MRPATDSFGVLRGVTAGCLLAVATVLVSPAASAATTGQAGPTTMSGLAISNDKPIQIESDSLKINDKEKIATFTGHVKVVQGDTTLQSGKMIVHYSGDGSIASGNAKIQRIDVFDKVHVTAGDQEASADRGSYDMPGQLMTLSGKQVVLTQGQNVFVGCKLVVHVDTSEANLESCGKRVMIQLNPKSQNSGSK